MYETMRARSLVCFASCVLMMGCAATPKVDATSTVDKGQAQLVSSLRAAGDTALREGSPRIALEAYLQVLQLDRTDAGVFFGLSRAYQQLGAPAEASAAMAQAVRLRPDDPNLLQAAGLLMTEVHRWELAAQYLQRAVDKGATSWQTFNALGICADMQANYPAASTYYAQAISLQSSALLYNNQGYSFYMAQNYGAAEKSFEAALGLEPANKLAWRNLALVRMRQGELDEALKAAFKGGDMHSALNDIGYIAMLDGQTSLAKFLFEQAIEVSPTKHYPRAEQNLQRLSSSP